MLTIKEEITHMGPEWTTITAIDGGYGVECFPSGRGYRGTGKMGRGVRGEVVVLGRLDWPKKPWELEAPIKYQPLPADASHTTISPGYIADFDPEEDEEDPEEDPADHPVDGGYNDDNESSDDDDDDDDVVKDEEDEEEEEHLALADPSPVLIYDLIPTS
ncbi:hypothetical protein Tco_1058387 [Tanacetum coccineum]|uniref:Uncharacterized protein n=1 Tax=Tanacetum coccineum TaxID=301880 RepID=A0ABQ5H9M0_9ASTR